MLRSSPLPVAVAVMVVPSGKVTVLAPGMIVLVGQAMLEYALARIFGVQFTEADRKAIRHTMGDLVELTIQRLHRPGETGAIKDKSLTRHAFHDLFHGTAHYDSLRMIVFHQTPERGCCCFT